MVNFQYASIKIDEILEANYRLEANIFNIKAREAREILKNCKYPIVFVSGSNGLASAYHRMRFKRVYIEKSDYPIFQPSQITDMKPKPHLYISDTTKTNIEALRVSENQILMTCSGSIGKSTIVTKGYDKQIFSHDLLRITANRFEDTGYLYAYFRTELGQNLIITNNYGSVIQHIEPEHLENVPIPNPPEEIKRQIHDFVMQSFALRDKSNGLIDQAEKLLIEELHLPSIEELEAKADWFHVKREYSYIENGDTFSVPVDLLDERFEASYHHPIVSSIIDILLDYSEKIMPLKELSSKITMPGIFKRVYVGKDEGVAFLGINDIMQLSPKTDKYLSIVYHKKLIEKHLTVNQNMILITDRGTIGNVVLVPDYYEAENWVVSQNVVRVATNDELAGFIYVFLQSNYGKYLIKRETYGAVIDMIDPENVRKIPIPILKDQAKQKQINDLALEANKLRSEAYYKEQEAIRLVNEEILSLKK